MRIGLGTVQFGLPYGISNRAGQVPSTEVREILQLAASNGLEILDTAASYGESEAMLGQHLGSVHNFLIVTKTLPLKKNRVLTEDVERAEAAFYTSLKRLRQSSVYGLLVHHSADLLNHGGERLYASLQRWKSAGLVRKVGVSVYDEDELYYLFERYDFDLVQLPLNVFDQRFAQSGTLKWLENKGIEVHVRSAFLQGLLLMPSAGLPPYFEMLKFHHRNYFATLKRAGVSPLAGALGYILSLPEVSTVLVGVETSRHLQECLEAAVDLPPIDYASFAYTDPKMLDPRVWV